MNRSVLVCACAALVCAPSALAQTVLQTVSGSAGSRFGAAAIELPDQNADGYVDVLVGEPGYNGGAGRIACISGQYVLSGGGPSLLWTLSLTGGAANDAWGQSLALTGDLTGDGVLDIVVGTPNFDSIYGANSGLVTLVDGATHMLRSSVYGEAAKTHLGYSLAQVGDVDGDGKDEVIAGAPGENPNPLGRAYVIWGQSLWSGGSPANQASIGIVWGEWGLGTSVAGGHDIDEDGAIDIVVGSPHEYSSVAGADSGTIKVRNAIGDNIPYWVYEAQFPGEHLGTSVSVSHDYNGDGVVDIVAGAPDWVGTSGEHEGRAIVISGATIDGPAFSKIVLYTYFGGTPGINLGPGFRLGAAVAASDDLNGDGVGDILIGLPDYSQVIVGPAKGGVRVFSGATGAQLGSLSGANNDRLGDTLLGAIQDSDGDGLPEFAIAGSLSDNPATDCGVLKSYRLFPCGAPAIYCTAKTNSLGCAPSMDASGGHASASSSAPFLATCASVLNQKLGLLFYSHAPNASTFQGGTLCVKPPTKRTPLLNSGGSASGTDCTGTFSFDFNARIQSGVDPTLVVGSEVFCQYWSRDSGSASGTNLSNALRFVINP